MKFREIIIIIIMIKRVYKTVIYQIWWTQLVGDTGVIHNI